MIFIVEDDKDIREMETYALKNSGFIVKAFSCGSDMFTAIETDIPKLVLLDIMLPDDDGLTILKKLRDNEKTASLPVILVSAKDTELDKVKGLDMGADDYLSKPFGIMELVSRVKALLRRTEPKQQVTICVGDIVVDDFKHMVTACGKNCVLTYKEYELLKCFMKNVGIALSREKLLENVWGYDYEGESRTVDMHIKTLRQKLGECGNKIKTIRNIGYKLEE